MKVWILKQLIVLGRGEVVPALARQLEAKDPLVRETARRALEQNPAGEATKVLRAALAAATEPAWQAALCLSLGTRRDAASVPAIARLLTQKDPAVVEAALSALGEIGSQEAARALGDAQASVPEGVRLTAAEAHLKCAERLTAAGRGADAGMIYRRYMTPDAARSIRLAAMAGMFRASENRQDDSFQNLFLELIGGKDADARAVAVEQIAELPGAGAHVASVYDKIPQEHRLAILAALAARGERAVLPAALAVADSSDPQVRTAGLAALGQLGDVKAVPVLAAAMPTRGDVGTTARESLIGLTAPETNGALLAILQADKDAKRREALVDVLEARGAPELIAIVLPDLQGDDAQARRRALAILGKLAKPENVAALLAAVLKAPPGGERDDAERVVATVCGRIANRQQQAEPVLAAYRSATAEGQLVLLSVLGRIGGPQALETIKAALAEGDAKRREAAVRGLCNWPDAAVVRELIDLAKGADTEALRLVALRAAIRVASSKGSLPEKEQLEWLTQALALAQRNSERNLVLQRVGSIRNVKTLRLVVPHLETPTLCTSASRAVVELAHHGGLKSREKAEYTAALGRVIELCKDKGTVEAAKKELRGD